LRAAVPEMMRFAKVLSSGARGENMARTSYFINALLLVFLLGALSSKSERAGAAVGSLIASPANDTEQVSDAFFRYIHAYEKKDLATLTKSFANDDKLQAFWPDPSKPLRIEGWNEMRKGLEGYVSSISTMNINIRQPIVQVYGSIAIVSCHWSFSGLVGNKLQVGSGRGSYVFEKRDGAWVIVHLHESSMPGAGK